MPQQKNHRRIVTHDADGSGLPLAGDPIDQDAGHFVDGLRADKQRPNRGDEVEQGFLFPGLLRVVCRFIATAHRGDRKALLFKQAHGSGR